MKKKLHKKIYQPNRTTKLKRASFLWSTPLCQLRHSGVPNKRVTTSHITHYVGPEVADQAQPITTTPIPQTRPVLQAIGARQRDIRRTKPYQHYAGRRMLRSSAIDRPTASRHQQHIASLWQQTYISFQGRGSVQEIVEWWRVPIGGGYCWHDQADYAAATARHPAFPLFAAW